MVYNENMHLSFKKQMESETDPEERKRLIEELRYQEVLKLLSDGSETITIRKIHPADFPAALKQKGINEESVSALSDCGEVLVAGGTAYLLTTCASPIGEVKHS